MILSPDFHDIYLSFDIDGLDPQNCPSAETPVAGRLSVDHVYYLLEKLVEIGKKIISFDLTEVAPSEDNEWDANVGARMLYKCAVTREIKNSGRRVMIRYCGGAGAYNFPFR